MNIEEFIKELQNLKINPSKEILTNLEIYKDMLIEYNNKFNLTAITNPSDIYLKHFYDSLTITKLVDLSKNLKLLDIGTGAGFPGLVLKIFFPNLEVTLIDSNNKKISFLKEVINKLNLKNITVLNIRAESLPENYREYFDIITSRAVSHLRILSELSIPYLRVNGYFIPLKGKIDEELEESNSTLLYLNSKLVDKIEFSLPFELSTRTILKIEKLKPTPKSIPRAYNQIIKKKLN